MVVFESLPVLLVATAVWLVWRAWLWRRSGGDPARELGILALFVWSLLVVRFTFFPLKVIFYDWAETFSLVPSASILQLLRETSSAVALRNIGGNIALFVPFGLLMPLLFRRVRTLGGVVWRALALSAAIELGQTVTRVRSTDVDDLLLNVAGAVAGYGALALARRIGAGRPWFDRILDRTGTDRRREPLLSGAFPVVVTAALTVPFMVASLVSATLGKIEHHAVSHVPGSSVVVRTDAGAHAFVVVVRSTDSGDEMAMISYERAMPGRYTWKSASEPVPAARSTYSLSITEFNTARGELPSLVVWGTNDAGAQRITVNGNGAAGERTLAGGRYFAASYVFDIYSSPSFFADRLDDFDIRFYDAAGSDVSAGFTRE